MAHKQWIEEGPELALQFDKRGGLLPAVVQDAQSGQILMLGYVNAEAFEETCRTGFATFWSTSRQELWTKGKTSGDLLRMEEVLVDCDQDALVYRVTPLGAGACHTRNAAGQARASCFYRSLNMQEKRLELSPHGGNA